MVISVIEFKRILEEKDIEKLTSLTLTDIKDIDLNSSVCYVNGYTPLNILCNNTHSLELITVIRKLIEFGADVNTVDTYGNTTLLHIVQTIVNDYTETIIDILLESGSDINMLDTYNNNVVMKLLYTIPNNNTYNIAQKLISKGVKTDIVNKGNKTAAMILNDTYMQWQTIQKTIKPPKYINGIDCSLNFPNVGVLVTALRLLVQ